MSNAARNDPADESDPGGSFPWVVTGASGYFGHHVMAVARARGIHVVRAGRRDGDDVRLQLADGAAAGVPLQGWLADNPAAGLLHLGAMARMAACSDDPELAMRCNGLATRALASAAAAAGVPFWLVSTDLVFDGGEAPYGSAARPSPRSSYGSSKAAGEVYCLVHRGRVVRVPLLFGASHDGRHGATDMFHQARRSGTRLGLFTNEWRAPLHVRDAAEHLWDLALGSMPGEVLHLAGPERIDRYGLWRRFVAVQGDPTAWTRVEVAAVRSDDPGRPEDVTLLPSVPPRRSLDEMLADS